MPTVDIALFTRLIFLQFPKSVFSAMEAERFDRLKEMREKGLTHLTLQILRYRDVVKDNFHDLLNTTMKELARKGAASDDVTRIANNWAVPLAVFRCLETELNISLSYNELFRIAQKGIAIQNAECKTNNELGCFWSTVQFMVAQGDILHEGDYQIKYLDSFSSDIAKNLIWNDKRPVLYMQKTRVFMLYKQNAKSVGEKVIPEESLKYYLENSKAYLGEKNCRYKVFNKGMPVYEKDRVPVRELRQATKVFRSYCFDYQKLVEEFDINFQVSSSETNEDEEDEEGEKSEEDESENNEDYESRDNQQEVLPF